MKLAKKKTKPAKKPAARKRRPATLSTKDLMGLFLGFQNGSGKSKYPHLVIATINEPIEPLDRGDKYEDPLNAALKKKRMGEVTGGGTQMNNKFEAVSADLEIELANLDDALEFTRQTLASFGAPKGSKLRITKDGRNRSIPIVK
jgi:hypothetical protein